MVPLSTLEYESVGVLRRGKWFGLGRRQATFADGGQGSKRVRAGAKRILDLDVYIRLD
jgi:hypothetical protein